MKFVLRSSILLAFLFSTFLINAQKHYEDGYVITYEYDTLFGKIKDRTPEPFGDLLRKIRFKGDGFFTKRYAPQQIRYYKKGNELFESLWIDSNSWLFSTQYKSWKGRGEPVFMKVIVRGFVNYYHWEFKDPESGYIDYIPFYKKNIGPEMVRVTQGIFGLKRKQLEVFFEDCPELVQKIRDRELNSPIEIAVFYNNWQVEKL